MFSWESLLKSLCIDEYQLPQKVSEQKELRIRIRGTSRMSAYRDQEQTHSTPVLEKLLQEHRKQNC